MAEGAEGAAPRRTGQRGDDVLQSVVLPLVRVALVVRLLTIVAALAGLVGEELTPQVLVAVLVLTGLSIVGLQGTAVLEIVIEHPLIAMVDVVVSLGVLMAFGVGSPLTIATLSTALLIGVLFRLPSAILLGISLTCGYILALDPANGTVKIDGESFFPVVGIPVTYLCLLGIGQSFRLIASQQAAAERTLRGALRAQATSEVRNRLARDMHDSFAKTLQGVALMAEALPGWIERDLAVAGKMSVDIAAAAGEAVVQARDVLVELRRDPFEQSLAEHIRLTCTRWSEREQINCTVEADSVVEPAPDVRHELHLSLDEALYNVSRHARASHVDVRMTGDGGQIMILVRDDGVGFDPRSILDRVDGRHFGIRGITERMSVIDGDASITSSPGGGTTVELRAPIETEATR